MDKWTNEYRYLILLLMVLFFAKVVALFLITQLIDNNLVGDVEVPEQIKTDSHLLRLLAYHWDSAKYVDLAWYGYNDGVTYKEVTFNYSFAPLYPFLIKVTNFIFGNFLLSAVVVSNVFYFLTLTVFFYLIRHYTNDIKISFYTTLIFGFFPMFFVFSLIAYSESVYLFFAILSWYFFEKKSYFYSGIALSFATLARYYGLLIVAVYLIIFLYEKKAVDPRKIFVANGKLNSKILIFLPVLIFLAFSYWHSTLTGNGILSIFEYQKAWGSSISNPAVQFNSMMNEKFIGPNVFKNAIERYMYTITFLILSFYFLRANKRLFIYSIIAMVFVLSLSGMLVLSTSRYVLLAWPVFIIFGRIKDPTIAAAFCAFFFMLSLDGVIQSTVGFYA